MLYKLLLPGFHYFTVKIRREEGAALACEVVTYHDDVNNVTEFGHEARKIVEPEFEGAVKESKDRVHTALVNSGFRPHLGRTTINLAPADIKKEGPCFDLPIAVGMLAAQGELEKDRQRGVLKEYGRQYDLVSVEGTLWVENFEAKAITLEISKSVSGEVTSSEPGAKVEKLAKGLRRVNGVSKLSWTVELEACEEKQISYAYKVYVRR